MNELLIAAFRLEGRRNGTPDVPDCPEGWVAVLFNRTASIVLVLGEHALWSAARREAMTLKSPSFKKAWAEARKVRAGNESWEEVRLIPKPVYDAVRVALELSR